MSRGRPIRDGPGGKSKTILINQDRRGRSFFVVMYRETRNYLNIQKALYTGEGEFGIPKIPKADPVNVEDWLGFNYVRGCEDPELHGVHFFLDDYQFNRIWDRADDYTRRLAQFRAVISPDFSMYTDFPKAVQIFNCYRNHWLGRYWAEHGVRVIPCVMWSDHESYTYCFDGDPIGSAVAVSSVGTQVDGMTKELFLDGYAEMLRRLDPVQILFYGSIPEEIEDRSKIVPLEAYASKWRE